MHTRPGSWARGPMPTSSAAASESVTAWTYERRYRRMRRFLPEFAARRLCELKTLSLESIGTQAVRQIPRHTDETHRAMLGLIDDLLAIRPATDCRRAHGAGASRSR